MATRSNNGAINFGTPGFGPNQPGQESPPGLSFPPPPFNPILPKIGNNPFSQFLTEHSHAVVQSYERFRIGAIVSGGQTGVDTAAFQFADKHKIPRTGFAPYGFINENGDIAPEYVATMLTADSRLCTSVPPHLQLPSVVLNDQLTRSNFARSVLYKQRTTLNSMFSCATLILSPTKELSPALEVAYDTAIAPPHSPRDVYVLPLLNTSREALGDASYWLGERAPILLHIVGPRESEAGDGDLIIREKALEVLDDLFGRKEVN